MNKESILTSRHVSKAVDESMGQLSLLPRVLAFSLGLTCEAHGANTDPDIMMALKSNN